MGMAPTTIGIIMCLILVVILVLKLPVAFSFMLTGFVGLWLLRGLPTALNMLGNTVWTQATSYVLMAVPMFVMMGNFAATSGIGTDLYNTAFKWLGKLPGGLAITTVWACTAFGACVGGPASGMLCFGPVAFQPMIDNGYDKSLALGSICCGSGLGAIIPPSISMIVYGTLTNTSISHLYMAGFIPGLFMAVLYTITIFIVTKFGIMKGPPGPASTWKEKFGSLKGVWGMLLIVLLVLGGIWLGFVTPTEGGAIGAFGAFIILVMRKGVKLPPIRAAINASAGITCMVYTSMMGVHMFSKMISLSGVQFGLSSFVLGLPLGLYGLLWLQMGALIILGCFMPDLPLILLTTPFLFPIFLAKGIDPVQYCILLVLVVVLGGITPPFGFNLFICRNMFKDKTTLRDLYVGNLPFIIADVIKIAVLIHVPAIIMWLPNLVYGK